VVFYLSVVLLSAWVSDDAYITMRTVDNATHGYGLTWNVVERVQTYTHPLWMLILFVGYTITQNAYTTLMIASLLASFFTLVLWLYYMRHHVWLAGGGVLLLSLSRSYVHYSTSGLENPLTHLLLMCFILSLRKIAHKQTDHAYTQLALCAGLAVFNRQDIGILLAPSLLWVFLRSPQRGNYLFFYKQRFLKFTLGFLPYSIWILFSLFYYGVPIPNTAYAKLNIGTSHLELSAHAINYFAHMLKWDITTLIAISVGIIVGVVGGVQSSLHRNRLTLAMGICLYLLYLLRIGGDFMAGRFFAAPFLIACILIFEGLSDLSLHIPKKTVGSAIVGSAILFIGLLLPSSPIQSHRFYFRSDSPPILMIDPVTGISDERGVYYEQTGLIKIGIAPTQPIHEFGKLGAIARQNPNTTPIVPPIIGKAPLNANSTVTLPDNPMHNPLLYQLTINQTVLLIHSIGFLGYVAGPEIYLLDIYALSDPLLARLPAAEGWRIGHFRRDIPEGYIESLHEGKNKIVDPKLANLYDRIVLITRGDLFSLDRIKAIIALNLDLE
jgi:arabinofuranosyltransferase